LFGYDYESEIKTFDIGELDSIVKIEIIILSGDEIALVRYKDHTLKLFDSSDSRVIDYYDSEYTVYDIADGPNIIDAWKQRKSSYDWKWLDFVG